MEGFVLFTLDPSNFYGLDHFSKGIFLLDSLIDRPTQILKDNIYHREFCYKAGLSRRINDM